MKIKKPSYKFDIVMLIDDNELDNFVNQKIIEGNNFAEKVYINSSGRSAVEFLQNILVISNYDQNLMPKVIFVDLNMPIMDGFQFIEKFELLINSSSQEFKLVILTTSINQEDKKKALKFKNNILFLNKPLTDESLAII
jgi:CheY-like chemotaxis protein